MLEEDIMDWLCVCGHRLGDHHSLDEDCCIDGCNCDGFNGVKWHDRKEKGDA